MSDFDSFIKQRQLSQETECATLQQGFLCRLKYGSETLYSSREFSTRFVFTRIGR